MQNIRVYEDIILLQTSINPYTPNRGNYQRRLSFRYSAHFIYFCIVIFITAKAQEDEDEDSDTESDGDLGQYF